MTVYSISHSILRGPKLASHWMSRIALDMVVAVCSLLAVRGAASAEPGNATNVVVILADDLGYGDLGCYGHPTFKTPRLDRLAAEGARLTHFNTPMPFCAPTRASLLTGRYPFHTGMMSNPAPDGGPKSDQYGLSLDEVTLADVLKRAGYATACIGKWHLGHQPQYMPLRRGFDEYYGIPYSNDMRPVKLVENDRDVEYPVVQATITRRYTARAIDFVRRNKDRPFFLYLPHAMPHKPLAVSEQYYRRGGDGLYADTMSELDASIGELLDALAELKLDQRTLVIFTSDNGPWYGGSTGGLRGMKGSTWEGGYRVPMIARWPGHIPARHESRAVASLIDIFPTVLKAVGVTPPAGRALDGRDLLPVLTGTADSPHTAIVGSSGAQPMNVRDNRWKLHVHSPGKGREADIGKPWVDPRAPDGVTILAPFEQYQPSAYPGLTSGDAPQPMMLFDLQADPGEQRNVAAQHPEQVERLKRLFDQLTAQVGPQK